MLVVLLTAMNLRGVRESGDLVRDPHLRVHGRRSSAWASFGAAPLAVGDLPLAESASSRLIAGVRLRAGAGAAWPAVFLLLRAFSSGCAALTGVEAISNGVPAFQQAEEPERRDHARAARRHRRHDAHGDHRCWPTLMDVRYRASDPAEQLLAGRRPGRRGVRAGTRSSGSSPTASSRASRRRFYLVAAVTGLILVLAANTAFNGFPVLGSILARDGYLPRQLHTRGDRLAFSNGILILAAAAIVLIVAFDAEVTRLIQLYIVGVFVSFTLSQTGMVRHWTRQLRTETDPAVRRRMKRSPGDQRGRPGDDRRRCWSSC